jgi:asparagine synthase (glutamine-hydrolysing)
MCGLAGIVDLRHAQRREELCGAVEGMTSCLRHRGPDDSGIWLDETAGIGLGFRRLAIIDLTHAGHQPQISHNGRLVIVFNGEIYNHDLIREELSSTFGPERWAGHSDTETLLAAFSAWGVIPTLKRTIGMFAIALWDREDRRLYLVRDRFGEKPLYYGWTNGAFVFGSELEALRRYPKFDNAIDRDVLSLYMQYNCVPAPYSIYRDIYKLQPGCVLSLTPAAMSGAPERVPFAPASGEGLNLERYWSFVNIAQRGLSCTVVNELEAIDMTERTLKDAVRRQSVADVPLGAFLSGGIDSSTIVALMQAQSTTKVKTFTIGFEDESYDEARHARAVAHHLGTAHTELYVAGAHVRSVIPKLSRLYSEPFADSSQIPNHAVAEMARQHVTVALSGDGGDEIFGGYTRYIWAPRIWKHLRRLPASARRALGAALLATPAAAWDAAAHLAFLSPVSRLGEKARKLGHRLNVDDLEGLYRLLVTTWPANGGLVIGANSLPTVLDQHAIVEGVTTAEELMMIWDTVTYLPDDILHKVDRASMGTGLEARAPFLDHTVAELAWQLPLNMKIRRGTSKWILRQILHRHVPEALIDRPKMGFSVPLDSWLRGPLREWADTLLSERRLRADGYLNPSPIRQKWTEHLSGRRNWHHELWPVLMFQDWLP